MTANYHTHTPRCRHASGSENEYIEKALSRGLEILGFSDHTPYLFPGDYYSTFRMFPEQTEDYFTTIERMKKEYAGKITIYSGLEAEYYPKHFSALIDLIKPYHPDYLILGQHFTRNEYDGDYSGAPTEDERILRAYVDQLIEGISTGLYSYIAHPDLIRFTGDEAVYEKHIQRLCEAAKKLEIPLEINMLGLEGNRHYPCDRFWKIAAGVGNDVVLGCDAHEPDAVANPETLKKAYDFAAKFDLKPLERVKLHPVV